jgi:metal-sulfur cluster biosynthetic enzyme
LKEKILKELQKVVDPELGVSIVDLGLVYGIDLDKKKKGEVKIRMTFTTPTCPAAAMLEEQVLQATSRVKGVKKASLEIVFNPPWEKKMVSKEARLLLGV